MLFKKWPANLPVSGIQSVLPVSGGDINDAFVLDTDKGRYFLKIHPFV